MTQEQSVPGDLYDYIDRKIEQGVAKAMRSAPLRNASISEGGTFTIKGGRLRVLYPADLGGGDGVFFGNILSSVTGVYQGTGLLIQDTDGTDVATFRSDAVTGNPVVILRDATESAVLHTDTVSGLGLGRPWFAGSFYPSRVSDWPGTSSGTFETLYRAKISKQNPKLLVRVWGTNDTAGATGELQVLVNNVPLAAVAATSNGVVTERQFFGSPAGNFGQELIVEIQGRLASGAGQVRVGPSDCLGRS